MTAIPECFYRESQCKIHKISALDTQNEISDLNTFGDGIKYKHLSDDCHSPSFPSAFIGNLSAKYTKYQR